MLGLKLPQMVTNQTIFGVLCKLLQMRVMRLMTLMITTRMTMEITEVIEEIDETIKIWIKTNKIMNKIKRKMAFAVLISLFAGQDKPLNS